MERTQLLDELPGEVLELILAKLDDAVDLTNCSRAHSRLDAEVNRWKCQYLMQQALPFILPKLSVKDALKIPNVCTKWRDAARNFDKGISGKLPYDRESYEEHMKKYKRDPTEEKIFRDSSFLSFNQIGKDLRAFLNELGANPEKVPFNAGRSVHFIMNHENWKVRDMYLHKLFHCLAKHGQHFLYVKITLTGPIETTSSRESFIRFIMLLSNIPNVRGLDLHVNFEYPMDSSDSPLILPDLPELETLSLVMHHELQHFEKDFVLKYVSQLKKLELAAVPGSLLAVMPCLIDLHLRDITSDDIFKELRALDAPLRKLKLHFRDTYGYTCSVLTVLQNIAHFPLEQLILQFDGRYAREYNFPKFLSSTVFQDFQFPNLHTLTLYNCPEPWCPFMICFPSLQYFNIRDTLPGENLIAQHREMSGNEEYFIEKMLGRVDPFVAPDINIPEFGTFTELKYVSVEIWKGPPHFPNPPRKIYCRLWGKEKHTVARFVPME